LPVYAQDSPLSADEILSKISSVNPSLKTLQVNLNIKAQFMGLTLPCKGVLFLKKPDKLKVELDGVPEILKGKKDFFNKLLPASFKPEDYDSTIIGRETLKENVDCFILELIPKKKKKIEKAYLWVETETFITPKTKLFYTDGGIALFMQNFGVYEDCILPREQYVNIDTSELKAEAHVTFKNYIINPDIDEKFKPNINADSKI